MPTGTTTWTGRDLRQQSYTTKIIKTMVRLLMAIQLIAAWQDSRLIRQWNSRRLLYLKTSWYIQVSTISYTVWVTISLRSWQTLRARRLHRVLHTTLWCHGTTILPTLTTILQTEKERLSVRLSMVISATRYSSRRKQSCSISHTLYIIRLSWRKKWRATNGILYRHQWRIFMLATSLCHKQQAGKNRRLLSRQWNSMELLIIAWQLLCISAIGIVMPPR